MHASSQSSRQRNCVRLREVLSARGFFAVVSIFPVLGSARVSLLRVSFARQAWAVHVASSVVLLLSFPNKPSCLSIYDERRQAGVSVNFLVPLELAFFFPICVSRVLGQDWDTTRDPLVICCLWGKKSVVQGILIKAQPFTRTDQVKDGNRAVNKALWMNDTTGTDIRQRGGRTFGGRLTARSPVATLKTCTKALSD